MAIKRKQTLVKSAVLKAPAARAPAAKAVVKPGEAGGYGDCGDPFDFMPTCKGNRDVRVNTVKSKVIRGTTR